ncbi:MAG: F0F1 ATP synthase subunit B [Spirochaetaceae bacterium]|jgi:F-type H+-transporting ATPase subunit b|nr:F0F1 ATP synthase subunit B [Spirochaetaceae bacterium]
MLSFSWVTFAVTIINIGILFFILRAILFKPVSRFMEERTKKIQDRFDEADREQNQAKRLLKEYGEKLDRAREEGELILRNAREAAQAEADRILAEGKAEADRFLAAARKQIEAERNAALGQFKAEAAVLVTAAASRLLRREINAEDGRRQAALLLAELGKGS